MRYFPTCGMIVPPLMIPLLVVGLASVGEVRRAAGKQTAMCDAELSKFKSKIDLRVVAASFGYELDRKSSWRGSAVMRHANGDKIAIKRGADSHYLYYSFRDDTDHGTVIDFVQRRRSLSLGAVRKELRPWLGAPPTRLPRFEPLATTTKDRLGVESAFAKMKMAERHPYLELERGIPAGLLASERFAGRVHIDARSNAVFAHYDHEGLSGYELRNRNFKGYSTGGSKGLWSSNEGHEDTHLIVCESAIDALSYAVAFPCVTARYVSIGGKPSPAQRDLIRSAIARMPTEAEIVAAMDSDAAGDVLVAIVREAFDHTGRIDLSFQIHQPSGTKDWNDLLLKRAAGRKADAMGGPSLS